MKILKAASAILSVAAMTMVFSPGAKAQSELGDYNRKTTVTFSGAVEIPGVHLKGYSVLPAGTYVFRLMDSTVNRHIVQILSADEKTVFATILAIPNTRVERTDKTVITFRERPNGEPPALRAWFYPDAAWGDEFVYPKAKAKEIAMATNTSVLSNSDDAAVSEVSEPIQPPTAPEVAQINAAPVMAYNPAGEEVQLSEAVTAPPDTQATTDLQASNTQTTNEPPPPAAMPEPAQLPQTGSDLPLTMVSGLFALGSALTILLLRRRSA